MTSKNRNNYYAVIEIYSISEKSITFKCLFENRSDKFAEEHFRNIEGEKLMWKRVNDMCSTVIYHFVYRTNKDIDKRKVMQSMINKAIELELKRKNYE